MYDVVIIGAGVTGLAAAMYAGRMNMKTLVLGASSGTEQAIGGIITLTEIVENYPGFIRLSGSELAENIKKHAEDYKDNVTIDEDRVKEVELCNEKGGFIIKSDEKEYQSKSIIFATGAKWKKLPMKGAKEFENKGVHYCALCDGPLYKNRVVAVVGGSDTAAKEALFFAEHASKVYIIYRGEKIRPEPVNAERVKKNEIITVINRTNIVEIMGDKKVSKISLDNKYQGKDTLDVDAVFGAIGSTPISGLAKSLGVKTNEKGEIIIDHKESTTNIDGVFAAGDITDKDFKQAITGVAEGVIAAHSAYKYVNENEFVTTFYDREYLYIKV
ncbi:MAG: FAD-dependent oxidoreductase [Candidatus Methanoperedens sp.]|nr:FAD-dependent oxidoreductase [Candidatus Methanoperedens sp.]